MIFLSCFKHVFLLPLIQTTGFLFTFWNSFKASPKHPFYSQFKSSSIRSLAIGLSLFISVWCLTGIFPAGCRLLCTPSCTRQPTIRSLQMKVTRFHHLRRVLRPLRAGYAHALHASLASLSVLAPHYISDRSCYLLNWFLSPPHPSRFTP